MRYTVNPGDTLAAIALRHGISLDDLLNANPALRANRDVIHVGQQIMMPDTASPPAPSPAAPRAAGPVKATQPGSWVLGRLSTKYETGGRGPTTVSGGVGDAGGISYGSYQMTSTGGGTVARFVSQPDFPWRDDFTGLTPGSTEFSTKWVEIATRSRADFEAVEHEFIKRTHFDPLCEKIFKEDGVRITACSHALQDVIWSTAVQHGPNTNVVHLAFDQVRAAGKFAPSATDFDRGAIAAIYGERGRKDANGVLVHFSSNSPAVQDGVARRFQNELADALRMLEAGV
jgi:phage tail protein X